MLAGCRQSPERADFINDERDTQSQSVLPAATDVFLSRDSRASRKRLFVIVGILARLRGHVQSAVSYAGEKDWKSAHVKIAKDPGRFLIPLSEASRRESFVR